MVTNAETLMSLHTHTWKYLTYINVSKQFVICSKCLFVFVQELFNSLTHTHWIELTNRLADTSLVLAYNKIEKENIRLSKHTKSM